MADQAFSDRLAELYRAGNPFPHVTPAQANVPILPVDDLEIHGAQPVPPISEDAMIQTISMLMARGPVKPHDIRCTEGGSLLTATTEGLTYAIESGGGEYQGPFTSGIISNPFSPTVGLYSVRFTWQLIAAAMISDVIKLNLTDVPGNILAVLAQETFVCSQVGASFYASGGVTLSFNPPAILQAVASLPPPYRLSASFSRTAVVSMYVELTYI